MATEYKLSYTASQIDAKLGEINNLAKKSELPSKTSDLTNDSGFTTETYVQSYAQPKGDYALNSEIPEVPVTSVNGLTGDITLGAEDVGAAKSTYIQISDTKPTDEETEIWINPSEEYDDSGVELTAESITSALGYTPANEADIPSIEGFVTETYVSTELSKKANSADLGSLASKSTVEKTDLSSAVQTSLDKADSALQSYTETDPTVPDWAKADTKPSYTKSEIGLDNVDNIKQYSASNPPPYPVTKVNNKTGEVSLTASDVGADASGTASSVVSTHDSSTTAHADIREAIQTLSNEKVDEAFLFDYAESNNYADMSTLQIGMLHTDGTVYTGGSYDAYSYLEAYIPVTEGEVLSVQYTEQGVRKWSETGSSISYFARVVAYDSAKSVSSSFGANNVSSYTVPVGVFFVRVTLYNIFLDAATDIAIVKNATTIVDYKEYGSKEISNIKEKFIPGGALTGSGSLYISLTDSVNVKTGNVFKVYFRNIISRADAVLWIGYHNSLTTRYYDEYFTVSASAEGEFELPWKVYDQVGNLLESGALTVIATAKIPTDATTAMVIGDSTVNDGTMTAKVAELYTADGAVLNLLGTRGGGTHEGRGGWTAEMYCTQESYGDVENPFYNDGFDFSYYMANQNFSGVQAVVIQLGINDIFAFKDYSWAQYDSAPVLGYINQMVTSILAYDPSIKVIINLPVTPNSNGTSFTEAYGTTQLYWFYNRNIIRFAKELKDYFDSNQYVTISASNCILDTKTQIRDGVHPTTDGYNALGQRLYEVLVSIVDGQVVVLPLLDISTRTRVSHTGATLSATSQRALDTTKCYDEVFNGTRAQNNVITTYTANGADSLSIQVSTAGGTGMNFPVALEAGKTYTLKYTVDNTGRVYVMKYNSDTTYNSNSMLSSTVGTFTKTITPEEGYIYGLIFVPMVANTPVTFSGIELTENT